MRGERVPASEDRPAPPAGQTPASRSLASAIGNRAFARMVQRSYADPGPHAAWVAGEAPMTTIADIRDYFQQNFKTVLLVYLNQLPFGRFMSTTDDGKHAEENFLDAWDAHWKRAAEKGYLRQHQLNQLEFVMNNSPCAEKCSGKLLHFVGGWNIGTGRTHQCPIHLYIRAQNVYGNDEKATTAVENLLQHPNISLEAYNPQVESAVVGLDTYARSPAYVAGQQRRQARAEAFFADQPQ